MEATVVIKMVVVETRWWSFISEDSKFCGVFLWSRTILSCNVVNLNVSQVADFMNDLRLRLNGRIYQENFVALTDAYFAKFLCVT